MRISKKKLLVEIGLLVVIAGISLALAYPLRDYFTKISETPFHDTYFIVDEKIWGYFIGVFPFFLFLITLIRQLFNKFKDLYNNILLLITSVYHVIFYSGFLIGGLYLWLNMEFGSGKGEGWTVHPPNSEPFPVFTSDTFYVRIETIQQLYFTIFATVIITTSFFLGKNSNRKNDTADIYI